MVSLANKVYIIVPYPLMSVKNKKIKYPTGGKAKDCRSRSSLLFSSSINIHPLLPGVVVRLCQSNLKMLLRRAPHCLLWNGTLLFLFVNCQHEAGASHQEDLLSQKYKVIGKPQTSISLTSFMPYSFLFLVTYEKSRASTRGFHSLLTFNSQMIYVMAAFAKPVHEYKL